MGDGVESLQMHFQSECIILERKVEVEYKRNTKLHNQHTLIFFVICTEGLTENAVYGGSSVP